MGGAYFLEAAGITVFLLNQTIAMIYVWFILYGIGQGAAIASLILPPKPPARITDIRKIV